MSVSNPQSPIPPLHAEVREKVRQAIDDGILTHTGRSVGDRASGYVADEVLQAVADALLAESALKVIKPGVNGLNTEWECGYNSGVDAVTRVIGELGGKKDA